MYRMLSLETPSFIVFGMIVIGQAKGVNIVPEVVFTACGYAAGSAVLNKRYVESKGVDNIIDYDGRLASLLVGRILYFAPYYQCLNDFPIPEGDFRYMCIGPNVVECIMHNIC
jgi:hypothetical protein